MNSRRCLLVFKLVFWIYVAALVIAPDMLGNAGVRFMTHWGLDRGTQWFIFTAAKSMTISMGVMFVLSWLTGFPFMGSGMSEEPQQGEASAEDTRSASGLADG